jgi:hypothetical protein
MNLDNLYRQLHDEARDPGKQLSPNFERKVMASIQEQKARGGASSFLQDLFRSWTIVVRSPQWAMALALVCVIGSGATTWMMDSKARSKAERRSALSLAVFEPYAAELQEPDLLQR